MDLADGDDADAIFHGMGEIEQAEAMRAARKRGFRGLLLGAEGGPRAPLARLAGAAAEGSIQLFASAAPDGWDDVYTAEAAAATIALVEAWSQTRERARIVPWLTAHHVTDTPLGPLSFDGRGDRVGARVTAWQMRAGQSALLSAFSRSRRPPAASHDERGVVVPTASSEGRAADLEHPDGAPTRRPERRRRS